MDAQFTRFEKPDSEKESESDFIDQFQSGRRRYRVRGVLVSDPLLMGEERGEQPLRYLFVLERMLPDELNLSIHFREWELSGREQQMVRLILAGLGNQEVADRLGLSINTVKGYLKLLMRKLGVRSRAGIISRLLTDKNSSRRE